MRAICATIAMSWSAGPRVSSTISSAAPIESASSAPPSGTAIVVLGPRRAIIDRLALGPASMTELAVTLPAVDKHLRVLIDGGLLTKAKHGRTTEVRLKPGSLQELAIWAMSTQLMWSGLLDRFEDHVADPDNKEH